MAKIQFVIEDQKNGMVKCVVSPSLEQIAKGMMKEHRGATPAEAYTFKAMHAIREASKRLDKLASKIVRPDRLIP